MVFQVQCLSFKCQPYLANIFCFIYCLLLFSFLLDLIVYGIPNLLGGYLACFQLNCKSGLSLLVVISHLLSKCSEVAATSFSLFYNMIFFVASKRSRNEDIITLQILAELSCLQIFIQDQTRNISEIKIEGNKISKKK